jgi:hypothetical protein
MSSTWNMHIPVISTGHLKRKTFLQQEEVPANAAYEHGLFLYLPSCDSEEPQSLVSVDLLALAHWLHVQYPGMNWVRLDADGDHIDDLIDYSDTWS